MIRSLSAWPLGLIVAGLFFARALPAQAGPIQQQAEPPPFAGDQGFSQALVGAIRSGDYPAALALIDARPDIAATAAGVRLRAELLARLARTSEAIALLEGHLARDPVDALARFQVAEIHFAGGRDRSATLAYRLALAGSLDDTRRRIIRARLDALAERRMLSVSVSASVAPDSNLNNATSATNVEIYGLPFVLSDEARRRSGVAASVSANVQRRWPLTERYAVVTGAALTVVEASGAAFDQSQWALDAGIEMETARDALASLSVTHRDIDFAHADFERWTGVRAEAQAYSNAQTRWDGSLHYDAIDNQLSDAQSGGAYGGAVSRTHFLGPSSLWRVSAAADVRDLNGPEADFKEQQVAAGRLFALPVSTLLFAQVFARKRTFDRPSTFFGVRRDDREIGISLRLSKRDWAFRNVFPFIQLSASRSSSNVVLGRYSRERMEFGVTRDF
ncbi:surface lipoprotein assembly modifier [Brevundimonas sp.]|uniref:surface lipoprotein assembly modifier n=1 Tax=Brevundimonas sp. TaxID=1871086 RepID=UPI002731D19E|nr:surface lipoprotein assembly modifier [Brevundimonas sp.]MDP1913790.1 surface lipoprotein assembly modifier [Brevundimonas sp.]